MDGAIANSFDILRSRIDRFGVTQPNIQELDGGRILVELPGIKDPARARKLLQSTAKLEFWETYECSELGEGLELANTYLRETIETTFDETAIAEEVIESNLESAESSLNQINIEALDSSEDVNDLRAALDQENS